MDSLRTRYKVTVTYNNGKVKTYGGDHVNEEGTPENIERHLQKFKPFGPNVVSYKVEIPEDPASVAPRGKAVDAAALVNSKA